MGKTEIEWTDYTFNPWWGCKKVSPACNNCYAERVAERFSEESCWDKGFDFQYEDYWQKPISWNDRARKNDTNYKVFTGSMCDIFQDHYRLEGARERLFELISSTPHLDWLLLTKRPENIEKWEADIPWWNIWLGVTAENQEMLDKRVPKISNYPANVRFVSCEPLLGEIILPEIGFCEQCEKWEPVDPSLGNGHPCGPMKRLDLQGIDWVIAGGESGPNARPSNTDWFRNLRDQCEKADVPYFFKHWGANIPVGQTEKKLDGETYQEFPEVE